MLDNIFSKNIPVIPFFYKTKDGVRIIISGQTMIESLDDSEFKNSVLISIRSTMSEKADIKAKFRDILFMEFDDIEFDIANFKAINQFQAREIANFVAKHLKSGIKIIGCQCEAGISRSAAVAAAILKATGSDDTPIMVNSPIYCPNSRVYALVLNELRLVLN